MSDPGMAEEIQQQARKKISEEEAAFGEKTTAPRTAWDFASQMFPRLPFLGSVAGGRCRQSPAVKSGLCHLFLRPPRRRLLSAGFRHRQDIGGLTLRRLGFPLSHMAPGYSAIWGRQDPTRSFDGPPHR